MAGRLEFITETGSASVLPYDGGVDGLAGFAVPKHRGFSLVCDPDPADIVIAKICLSQGRAGGIELGLPDFEGVMFNPTGLGVILAEFFLSIGDDVAITIEENGA